MNPLDRYALTKAMQLCKMPKYPEVVGDPNGNRVSGDSECPICGQFYYSHPMDWRLLGVGDLPFLRIICTGERVKL